MAGDEIMGILKLKPMMRYIMGFLNVEKAHGYMHYTANGLSVHAASESAIL